MTKSLNKTQKPARERIQSALDYLNESTGIHNAEHRTNSITIDTPEASITIETPYIAATSTGSSGIVALDYAATQHNLHIQATKDTEYTHELRLPPKQDI